MNLQLNGRLVAITGAGSGIGRATALALAAEGAALVLGGRTAATLEAVAGEASELGAAAVIVVAADLTTAEGVATLGAAISARPEPLHGLLTCVGSTPIGPFDEIDDDAWNHAFTMKFLASVRALRMATALMDPDLGGRVVMIAGNAGRAASTAMVTSAVMNSALDALVATVGRDFAPRGIGVVGIHPGLTRTPRYDAVVAGEARRSGTDLVAASAAVDAGIPVGRPATAEEIAGAAAYLLSPLARHVVATCLTVDGGQTWG
jgi:NAD(P)-dependent dehydrogenase (short-subunit alcohol dehydrogenase family)